MFVARLAALSTRPGMLSTTSSELHASVNVSTTNVYSTQRQQIKREQERQVLVEETLEQKAKRLERRHFRKHNRETEAEEQTNQTF